MTQPGEQPHEPESQRRPVKLHWEQAPDLTIIHADQLGVGFRGDYFLITIGQVAEPVFSQDMAPDLLAELQDQLEETGIGIRPIARFAVPNERFADWVNAMVALANRFLETTEDEGAEV